LVLFIKISFSNLAIIGESIGLEPELSILNANQFFYKNKIFLKNYIFHKKEGIVLKINSFQYIIEFSFISIFINNILSILFGNFFKISFFI